MTKVRNHFSIAFDPYLCTMDMIYTLAELEQVAASLIKQHSKKSIWAFRAPMGAGKTTLIATIGKQLGIQETIASPTFSIMNEYEIQGKLVYHMDLYRLSNEAEARQAGVEAAMLDADYCFVEWPEKAPGLFPPETVYFEIEILDPTHRRIHIPTE